MHFSSLEMVRDFATYTVYGISAKEIIHIATPNESGVFRPPQHHILTAH